MDERFGPDYARSLATDYRLPKLSATINEAIDDGVDVKDIWKAVCAEFDVPRPLQ
jgi:Protein of unknown function (DUF3046)